MKTATKLPKQAGPTPVSITQVDPQDEYETCSDAATVSKCCKDIGLTGKALSPRFLLILGEPYPRIPLLLEQSLFGNGGADGCYF